MLTINKLVEDDKITYTTPVEAGAVTIVVQKGVPEELSYCVTYHNGTAELPTWQDFCTALESTNQINLL